MSTILLFKILFYIVIIPLLALILRALLSRSINYEKDLANIFDELDRIITKNECTAFRIEGK